MSLPAGLIVVAVVAAVAQIERKGFLQAALSRPLVLAPLLGWALGDLRAGLAMAVPLELLWLGALNIGANLPDNEVVGVSSIVGGAVLAAGGMPAGPELMTLALLLLAPTAVGGRWADQRLERWNVRFADRAATALAAGHEPLVASNVLGLVAPAAVAAVLAALGAAAGALILPELLRLLPAAAVRALPVAWVALAAAGGAAAAVSIRARRAPVVAGSAALTGWVVLSLLALLVGWGGTA